MIKIRLSAVTIFFLCGTLIDVMLIGVLIFTITVPDKCILFVTTAKTTTRPIFDGRNELQ